MQKGTIILLNGVSSSGKTTLSKELIHLLPNYFHLSIDDFDLLIEKMEDRENGRLIPVPTEYFFHRTIAMFSDRGTNVVVDQLLHDRFTMDDCYEVLQGYPVFFVGVHCPLKELERREKARGDRQPGLSKQQLQFIHQQNELYDIEVNTYQDTYAASAKKITDKLHKQKSPHFWAAAAHHRQLNA
jgi:chloramphenicol 3-O phosphotransferase